MLIHTIARTPLRQKGAVLIIGLIFLVVITLLGITAMQRTTLDTKIVGNYKSYRTAFEGAEAAVMDGECRLIPTGNNFIRPKVGGTETKIWRKNVPYQDCTGASNARLDWWFSCESSWWQKKFRAGNVYAFSAPFFGLEDNAIASRPLYLFEGSEAERDFINVDPPPPQKSYYRITARSGTGPNSQSNVMVQTIFAWRYIGMD